jgi:hypothetical protein
MPARIVLDHSEHYRGRRLWRRTTILFGAVVLIVLGTAATIVAIPTTFLTLAWVLDEDVEFEIQPGRNLTANEILLAWEPRLPSPSWASSGDSGWCAAAQPGFDQAVRAC